MDSTHIPKQMILPFLVWSLQPLLYLGPKVHHPLVGPLAQGHSQNLTVHQDHLLEVQAQLLEG